MRRSGFRSLPKLWGPSTGNTAPSATVWAGVGTPASVGAGVGVGLGAGGTGFGAAFTTRVASPELWALRIRLPFWWSWALTVTR